MIKSPNLTNLPCETKIDFSFGARATRRSLWRAFLKRHENFSPGPKSFRDVSVSQGIHNHNLTSHADDGHPVLNFLLLQ